jgi:hypothetical protein
MSKLDVESESSLEESDLVSIVVGSETSIGSEFSVDSLDSLDSALSSTPSMPSMPTLLDPNYIEQLIQDRDGQSAQNAQNDQNLHDTHGHQHTIEVDVRSIMLLIIKWFFIFRFFIGLSAMLLLIDEYDDGIETHCSPLLHHVIGVVVVVFITTVLIVYCLIITKRRLQDNAAIRNIEEEEPSQEPVVFPTLGTRLQREEMVNDDIDLPSAPVVATPVAAAVAANSSTTGSYSAARRPMPRTTNDSPTCCSIWLRTLFYAICAAGEIALIVNGADVVIDDPIYPLASVPCSSGPARHVWYAAAAFFYVHSAIYSTLVLCCLCCSVILYCSYRRVARRNRGPATLSNRVLNKTSETFLFDDKKTIVAATTSSSEEKSTLSSDQSNQCPICLGDYEAGEKIRRLHCGHEFHCECIDMHLRQYVGSCPLCKQDPRVAQDLTNV